MDALSLRDTVRKAGDWVSPAFSLAAGKEAKHKVTIVYQVPLHFPPRRFWRPWSPNLRAPGSPREGETPGQGSTEPWGDPTVRRRGAPPHLGDVPCAPLLTWEAGQQKAEELGQDTHVRSKALPEALFCPRCLSSLFMRILKSRNGLWGKHANHGGVGQVWLQLQNPCLLGNHTHPGFTSSPRGASPRCLSEKTISAFCGPCLSSESKTL